MEQQVLQRGAERRRALSLNGSTLKLIAIFSMLIDHIAAVIITHPSFHQDNDVLIHTGHYMRMFGRLAFPIFCFLLVEGMIHTRSRRKYAVRLAVFALLSEIPFDLAFSGRLLEFGKQNVFFTLLIGLLVLCGFELVREKWGSSIRFSLLTLIGLFASTVLTATYVLPFGLHIVNLTLPFFHRSGEIELSAAGLNAGLVISGIIWLIAYLILCKRTSVEQANTAFVLPVFLFAGVIAATLFKTDYNGYGVLTIAVMYLFRRHRIQSMISGSITLTLLTLSELWAFLDVILIYLYNGKRGFKLKYVFYLFYPVHLLLLYFISRLFTAS